MTILRARFPALQRCTYLNTAGGAPVPDVARKAATAYYREAYRDGDAHWDEWLARTDGARDEVGGLVGCPPEHVAFVGNASVGLNAAAFLDEPGSVGFAECEFPSCTLPWIRRGFDASAWPVREDGYFDADDVRWSIQKGATTIVVSQVQFGTGFRADLRAIADVCRGAGVRLVVDATQGVAAFPIHATDYGIDVLVFSGYKWITAGYGVAAVVIPQGLSGSGSPLAGWRSQSDPFALVADRLEPSTHGLAVEAGHPPFPGAFAMGAAAAIWHREGVETTAETILNLMTHLHARMDTLGVPVLSTRDPAHMSGITMLGLEDPATAAAQLKARGIVTSARAGGLRVSAHAYNTAAEIDLFADTLADIAGLRPRARLRRVT